MVFVFLNHAIKTQNTSLHYNSRGARGINRLGGLYTAMDGNAAGWWS